MSDHESKPLPDIDLSKPPAENIVRVTFEPENKTVEFPFGSLHYDGHGQPMSFLDVAENYGIFLDHACGGVAACTTCHIFLKEGASGVSASNFRPACNSTRASAVSVSSKSPALMSPRSPPGTRTTFRKASPQLSKRSR